MEATIFTKIIELLQGSVSVIWKRFTSNRPTLPRLTLRLVADEKQCWWSLGTVGGSPAMQVVSRWHVTNVSDKIVHVVGARLLSPNVQGLVAVRDSEGRVFGSFPISPEQKTDLMADFWIQPPNREEGQDLVVRLEFTDNLGNRHKTKKTRFQSRPRPKPQKVLSGETVYSITDPIIKKVVSVLKAEVDRYRGCGRRVGGLGSVQTSLDGKKFTGVGTDWRKPDSPIQQEVVTSPTIGAIHSENLDALLAVFQDLVTTEERETFVRALIARIHRDEEYASVGYFIILALFRLGRLSEGLSKAKADLMGDKEYGFSNLLWVIDGLLRFEHPLFSEDLLDDIERTIDGIEEHPFRIPQRIAAIRALRLSRGHSEGGRLPGTAE